MLGKWKGTSLFLAIFVVMGATFGLRLYLAADQSAITTSLATAPGTTTATGAAAPPTQSSTTPTTPSAAPSTGSATSGSNAAAAAVTITGATESTRYGNVQVAVSFSGKTITGVSVLQVPNSNNYDQRVAQAVPPILQQEVIASQSTAVNTVSGGTYTSTGYLLSVQSAIDKLP